MKPWFEFKNAADPQGRIVLSVMGEIGSGGYSAKDFASALAGQDPSRRILLKVYSAGGDIFEGNEIANILSEWKPGVDVECGALCASIATVVAMAGQTITMPKNGLWMIHNPWCVAIGDSEKLRKMADLCDTLKSSIAGSYTARTKKDEATISKLMNEETWMTASEAKEAGFIDSVRDTEEDSETIEEITNRFDILGNYRNALKALSRVAKESPPKTTANPQAAVENKQPAQPTETMLKKYLNGRVRIFNDAALDLSNPEVANALKAEAKKLHAAKISRDNEILNIVESVKTRDNRDFSNLAKEFISEDKTPDEFRNAVLTSDKFTPVNKPGRTEIEVIEPLDSFKGSVGFAVVTSESFRAQAAAISAHKRGNITVEAPQGFKNVATGATKTYEQVPGIVEVGVRPLRIEQLIDSGTTDQNTIIYLQETAAAEITGAAKAENAVLDEDDVVYTQLTAPVASVGGYITAPEVMLADLPAVASLINTRLPYKVERAMENGILSFDGTGGAFTGILESAGLQSIAFADVDGTDNPAKKLDLIRKALTKIQWQNMGAGAAQGGFDPDGIAMHPSDWEAISMLKDGYGRYYKQDPFATGDGVARVWGLPVSITPAVALNKPIVGAWKQGAQLFNRQGVLVELTNSDGTNFTKRLVTIRAARRAGLAVWRPANFVEVNLVAP